MWIIEKDSEEEKEYKSDDVFTMFPKDQALITAGVSVGKYVTEQAIAPMINTIMRSHMSNEKKLKKLDMLSKHLALGVVDYE